MNRFDFLFYNGKNSIKYPKFEDKIDAASKQFKIRAGIDLDVSEKVKVTPFTSYTYYDVTDFTLSESETLKWASPDTSVKEYRVGTAVSYKNSWNPKFGIASVTTSGVAFEGQKKSFSGIETKFSVEKGEGPLKVGASLSHRSGKLKEYEARIGVKYSW